MPPVTPVTTTGALENLGTNHQVGENHESDPPEGRATHDPCALHGRGPTHPGEPPAIMGVAMKQPWVCPMGAMPIQCFREYFEFGDNLRLV